MFFFRFIKYPPSNAKNKNDVPPKPTPAIFAALSKNDEVAAGIAVGVPPGEFPRSTGAAVGVAVVAPAVGDVVGVAVVGDTGDPVGDPVGETEGTPVVGVTGILLVTSLVIWRVNLMVTRWGIWKVTWWGPSMALQM